MSAVLAADHALPFNRPVATEPDPGGSPLHIAPSMRLPGQATYRQKTNWSAIGLILASHVLLVFGLLQISSVRESISQATPLMVSLITEVKPERPQEILPEPRKLMVMRDAPAPSVLPPIIEANQPQVQTQPAISMAEARQTPATPEARPGPARPSEIIPPNFIAAYLDNPAPPYPPISKRMREQGTVTLRVLVTPEGRAEKVEIQASSGSPRLDTAALNTVEKWRFVPARQGAQAIASWVLVPVEFQLTS